MGVLWAWVTGSGPSPAWIARVAKPRPLVRTRGGVTSANEEAGEHEHEARGGDQRAVPRLLAEELHGDRGAGRARVAQAAAPRFVPRDVLVLGLEGLVAGPRPARPRPAERDQRDAAGDEDEVDDTHISRARRHP